MAPVCDFSWFDDPNIFDFFEFLFVFFIFPQLIDFLHLLLAAVEVLLKFLILRIIQALLDVKRHGNVLKDIFL